MSKVTGADLAPFLKMRPEAPLVVHIDGILVPVKDVYYDNEMGYQVIELDIEPEIRLTRQDP